MEASPRILGRAAMETVDRGGSVRMKPARRGFELSRRSRATAGTLTDEWTRRGVAKHKRKRRVWLGRQGRKLTRSARFSPSGETHEHTQRRSA